MIFLTLSGYYNVAEQVKIRYKMKKSVKILIEAVLLVVIAALVYAIYCSIMEPVNFNKQKEVRQVVAVQRLKDIRSLQVAYKSVTGHYTASIDSLAIFYNEGKLKVVMQIGSEDDSLAMAHTGAVKKSLGKKATGADLYKLYQEGDKNLVFSVESELPVKDTLFAHRTDFCVDSLKFIPFSNGQRVEMDSENRMVSGVNVPLFEARMPWRALLYGMDNQLRINLDAQCRDQNKYEGLQVGSISAPNNNAGNWE